MANQDRPHGFSIYGPLLRSQKFAVDVGETTGIFIGDIVMMENDGCIAPASAASVTKLGASLVYHAGTLASTGPADEVLVASNTNQLFEAQDNGATTPAQTDLGNLVDHVAGSGSTTTLLSAHELDLGTLTSTAAGFQLLDFVDRPDNEQDAVNADWIVQLNTAEGLLTLAAGV